ncbi:DNA methyltransferase [Flavobacterium sp. GSP14]|uniref:DNA methyltransferase n=1 Tax=Flavobacterium sp. GSP14 TaxID=3401734 RepID=UPI003AB0F62C
MKLYATVEAVLKKEPNYVTDDGDLKKWVIISKAQNCDTELISILLENQEIKTHFFIPIKDILVFNQALFIEFMEQKNYLNDSFTAYKNKIGLTIDGKFLNQRNEVALVWPYKDCILEGGQSREEDKREEIFFNEVLAQDEINQLLDPKVLTNAKTFTAEGEKAFDGFNRNEQGTITDNLVIKGNNLLALHSLKEEFAGKVKLIYIDPPYNTGSDSFGYNDNFNHSTWLTFMKNRLEVAKELLREDGVIFVQCDDNEQAYLKVLMDGIFGNNNFDSCITTIVKTEGRRYGNLARTHESILLFTKNKAYAKIYEVEKENHKFKFTDNIGGYDLTDLRNQNAVAFNSKNRPNLRYPFYVDLNSEDENKLFKVKVINNENENEVVYPITVNGLDSVWRWGRDKAIENENHHLVARRSADGIFRVFQKYRSSTTMEKTVWFDKNLISNKGTKELDELFKDKIFDFPKPEFLLKKIIDLSTIESDIILDFHLGSGTTAAVANKMNRQYIGIEQMDYIETVAVERLKKVIAGEQGGISKSVDWQGGGSFTYLELKKYNQTFIDKILEAKDSETLFGIWEQMKNKSFLNYNIAIQKQEEHIEDFKKLEFSAQQELLITLLDKNQLYVNLSSLQDKDFECTDEELKVTQDFYQLKK